MQSINLEFKNQLEVQTHILIVGHFKGNCNSQISAKKRIPPHVLGYSENYQQDFQLLQEQWTYLFPDT